MDEIKIKLPKDYDEALKLTRGDVVVFVDPTQLIFERLILN